jgi:hypothetical protein
MDLAVAQLLEFGGDAKVRPQLEKLGMSIEVVEAP